MTKRIILIVSILLNVLFLTSFASNSRDKIEAYLCTNMPVYFNNKQIEFVDSDTGDTLAPIIFKDRAYVPVRCLQQISNLYADYSSDEDSLYLNNVTSNRYSTISTGIDLFFIFSNIDNVVPRNEIAIKYLNKDNSIIQDWTNHIESINAVDYSLVIPPMLFDVDIDSVIQNLEANNFTLAEKNGSMYYKNGTVEVKLTPSGKLLQIDLVTGYKSTYAQRDLKFL